MDTKYCCIFQSLSKLIDTNWVGDIIHDEHKMKNMENFFLLRNTSKSSEVKFE